ncbi:collagen [Mactra antiquata]
MAKVGIVVTVLACTLLQTALSVPECNYGLERCDWEPWSEWSTCSRSCGKGTQTRSRGLCCNVGEQFEPCLKRCNLTDDAIQTTSCGSECPVGNCTFVEVKDTGLDATNYKVLYNSENKVTNVPITLRTNDKEFCASGCEQANLQNGLFCWGYTFTEPNNCRLYFYSEPLVIANTSLQGQSPGESMFVRQCQEKAVCRATSADIVFVVDSSGSIGDANFQKIKKFLEAMINKLDIDNDLTRVGLLVFNDNSNWVFKLGELDNELDVLKAIQRIKYVIGGTMTGDALNTVRTEGFLNNRTGVPMLAVVITDGLSRFPPLTRFQANLLRREGVDLYAIGVGSYANHEELFNIASSPEEKHLFEFGDFDTLNADNITLPVNYVDCKEEVTTTTPAVTTATQSTCFDKNENCQLYGKDVCTDYAPWAHANCALYCNFCQGPSTPPPVCEDSIPNCASFGQYYCQNKEFVNWVTENCPRFCGICDAGPTEPTTTTIATTPATICKDTIDNCDDYLDSCTDPEFKGFLTARCSASCGFCQSFKTVNSTTAKGNECPEWFVPVECALVSPSPDCCPIPECPTEAYRYTAEKIR